MMFKPQTSSNTTSQNSRAMRGTPGLSSGSTSSAERNCGRGRSRRNAVNPRPVAASASDCTGANPILQPTTHKQPPQEAGSGGKEKGRVSLVLPCAPLAGGPRASTHSCHALDVNPVETRWHSHRQRQRATRRCWPFTVNMPQAYWSQVWPNHLGLARTRDCLLRSWTPLGLRPPFCQAQRAKRACRERARRADARD